MEEPERIPGKLGDPTSPREGPLALLPLLGLPGLPSGSPLPSLEIHQASLRKPLGTQHTPYIPSIAKLAQRAVELFVDLGAKP